MWSFYITVYVLRLFIKLDEMQDFFDECLKIGQRTGFSILKQTNKLVYKLLH